MNKTVTATEANRAFSRLLEEVRKGQEITITSHGEVVARLVPGHDADEKERREKAWKVLLERLRQQPALNSGPWSRDEAYE